MSKPVMLEKVRLAFPALFTPKSFSEGPSRYSAVFIVQPGSQADKTIRDAIKRAATEKWGEKADAIVKKLWADKRVAYRLEPRVDKDGNVYDGFENMHSLSASNRVRPTVVDRDRTPLSEEDGRPYGGCYVNAMVDIYAQDDKNATIGRRINATLLGVQFVADGESFGAIKVAKPDAFQVLGSDAGDLE